MTLKVIISMILICIVFPAYAVEDVPPAVPAPSVKAEALPLPAPKKEKDQKQTLRKAVKSKTMVTPSPKSVMFKPALVKGFYVLELFSSQACTFCPKADELIKAYIDQPYMIALSCHVDYYDVIDGALSLPICSARQNKYELSLDIGPKYIPQIVVNGQYNATGYLTHEIAAAFKQARPEPITPITVERLGKKLYQAKLPDREEGKYHVWLYVYEKPKTVKVKDGGNIGKTLTYYNLVSKAGFLGVWNGAAKDLKFDAKMGDDAKGFAIMVQDPFTNQIILATKVE